MILNIDAAYKAVEILKRDGPLFVEYVGEEEPLCRFVANSCGYAEYGASALEATLKLFRRKYPDMGLSFVNASNHGWS
jgi:hypothetical protein